MTVYVLYDYTYDGMSRFAGVFSSIEMVFKYLSLFMGSLDELSRTDYGIHSIVLHDAETRSQIMFRVERHVLNALFNN
jgi:hypothetical protein